MLNIDVTSNSDKQIVFLANNGHFKILRYLVENGELNIEKYYKYIERMADIYMKMRIC